jgi:TonB-linked SusC/RagA family outer membrane protein
MKKPLILIALFAFMGMQLFAQTKTITGKVTVLADGTSLPGVAVVVKGTTIGTVTDLDGNYSLEVPSDAESLQFMFVGMKTKEAIIGNQTVIDVTMEEDFLNLEEVIVTGYSTVEKNQITGSTVQVTGDVIKDVPVVSVDQTLQGKVAGLTISASSGTPGSIQDIRIRGVGSISAGNDPLIVIDGVPVINDNVSGDGARSSLSALSAINSNDIESITVLKDASATSAYGARGSNGVIVITTKKGKRGQTRFNAAVSYGFQNKATDGRRVMTAQERMDQYLDGVYNTYGEANGFTREEAFDWALSNGFGGAAAYQDWMDAGAVNGDWEKALLNENAPVFNANVSASGGDEDQSFYASLGYNSTEATVKGPTFRRINGSINYNRNFGSRVKFSTTNTVSNTLQDLPILEQSAYFQNPHLGKYFMSPLDQPLNEDGTPNITPSTGMYNWLYLKDNDEVFNNVTRAISNSFLEVEIIEGLRFKTLISLDYSLAWFKEYQNRNYGDSEPENGTSYASDEKNFNYVTQNSLDYDLQLNEHRIQFKALMEYQKNNRNVLWGYGEDFLADGLTNIASAGANWDASSSFSDWSNLSYLGMINYNYQGKYIADVTYRREGSSRFAADQRFGDFWSVGAAWNIGQEAFLSDVDFIDQFRIRGSYGVSGNSDVGLNQYQALLSYNADYAGTGAIYPSEYGNQFLTWEKNRNFDVGIDFAFWSQKIGGSVSYFNKYTFDLLQAVPLTRTSGHNSITQNVGAVLNSGVEFLLKFDIIRTTNFNLNLSANFATLQNEVKELAKDANGEDINIQTGTRKIQVGHPINEWHMRKWAGVNPENGDALWYLNGSDGETTTDYYEAEEAFQGKSALPTYSGGFGLNFEAYGAFLTANFYFAGGNQIYEDWSFYTWHSGRYTTDLYQGVADLRTAWKQPGDVTDVPRQEHNYVGQNASRTSTRFLYDGDYMRLKDLVIGYNLPASVTNKIGFDGIQVYVRGTNIWTWVKDDRLKYDPEVRADGFTRLTTPPVKSFVFGLNLNF